MVTVADLIRYRMSNERYVHRVAEGVLPTEYGDFRMISYESDIQTTGLGSGDEAHLALTFGDVTQAALSGLPVLVRVQTHCLTGNVFGSSVCDCRATVDASLREIAKAGCGALIYLHHTQRGFLVDATAYPARLCIHRGRRATTDDGAGSPSERILRHVGLGGQIISDLGIHKIRLLTNHPKHVPALQGFEIEIIESVPIDLRSHSLTSM
jgi:3,4-dihydroxy 2-butanone 4-phosphate synthase/GTP cyclohydrolase II